MSLLNKAIAKDAEEKRVPKGEQPVHTKEEIEFAIAYAQKKISHKAAVAVLNETGLWAGFSDVNNWCRTILFRAAKAGQLIVVDNQLSEEK